MSGARGSALVTAETALVAGQTDGPHWASFISAARCWSRTPHRWPTDVCPTAKVLGLQIPIWKEHDPLEKLPPGP